MLSKESNIFVSGHKGMVGSAIIRLLENEGYKNILVRSRSELDLTNQEEVNQFLSKNDIECTIVAAAKVGGIHANNEFPAEFIYENLMIECNLIHGSHVNGIDKLLFLGSSCIYPKNSEQPIKEEYLLTNVLEKTNEPYAIAKIAGIKMCESYNRQFGRDYRSLMPTNLYGPNDNFHSKNSHVLPALLSRFHNAKIKDLPEVEVWGTGKPKREFLHVDDLASAALHFLKISRKSVDYFKDMSYFNVGTGKDISIEDLCKIISEIVDYRGKISFDTSKPDGTLRKVLDVSKMEKLGWKSNIALSDGLKATYNWYLNNLDNLRNV